MPTLAIPAISARSAQAMAPVFLPNADGNVNMLWHTHGKSITYALPRNCAPSFFDNHSVYLSSAANLSHYKRGFWQNNEQQLLKLLPSYDNVLLGLPCPSFPVPFEYVLNASKQLNFEQACDEWFEADLATAMSPNCKTVHVLDEGQADALVSAGLHFSKLAIGKYRYINKDWLIKQARYVPLPLCDALITFKHIKEHATLIGELSLLINRHFIATNETMPHRPLSNCIKADITKEQLFSWYIQGASIVPYGRHEKIYRLGLSEALALGAKLYEL